MAKFRTNHQKRSATPSPGMAVKVGLFAALIGGLYWIFNQFSGTESDPTPTTEQVDDLFGNSTEGPQGPGLPQLSEVFLPNSTEGQVIRHEYYALSYSEEHEQAEWVAYELTRESLKAPNVQRTGDFRPDPHIRKASASTRDYKGSGYDRGHLVPAGDMAFSKQAMSETFYMSNMSPQIRNFNGGIWRELEENTRDWAYKFRHLYVVTGPVLSRGIREQIGGNGVSVPDEYFKVLLDLREPEVKAIAFLIPNEISTQPLEKYATSINQVEQVTGLDFFGNLLKDDRKEEELESTYDVSLWPTNLKKYEQRVESWNRRK